MTDCIGTNIENYIAVVANKWRSILFHCEFYLLGLATMLLGIDFLVIYYFLIDLCSMIKRYSDAAKLC
jgi:hypothetical protein